MIIKIIDNTGENCYINPSYIVYVKERPAYGLFKISFSNGESILTKEEGQVKTILKVLEDN